MTERSEMLLRNRLLSLVPTSVEASIPDLLDLRFARDGEGLSPETQARHLDALHARLNAHSNGLLGRWAGLSGGRTWRRNLLWPALAIGTALLLLLILLNRPKFRGEQIVNNPPTPKRNINVPPQGPIEKTPRNAVAMGTFGRVQGEPTYRLPGESKSFAILPNQPVYARATIHTGDMDKAEIKFSDGTTIAMGFNTTLVLPQKGKLAQGSPRPSELGITSGKVYVQATHLANSQPFSVKTPVATAKVIGTKFSVALVRDKKLKAVLQVAEGKVAFFNDHGSVVARGSTESTAIKDARPTEPRRIRILGAFDVSNAFTGITIITESERLTTADARRLYAYSYGFAGLSWREGADKHVHVTAVAAGKPAHLAGVKVGDIIVGVDGKTLLAGKDFSLAVAERPGKRISLTLERKGHRIETALITSVDKTSVAYPATLPRTLADELRSATWQAISGQTDSALHRLLAITRKSPNAPSFNNIGVVYETSDKMVDAIRSYQAAVRLDPGNWFYHFVLGHSLKQIGNFDRATDEFKKADSLGPDSNAGFALCDVVNLQDRPDRVLEILESHKARWSKTSRYWKAMSQALRRLRRISHATTAARKAVELDPSNEDSHSELGFCLLISGKLREAEMEMRRAVALNPQSSQAHTGLGIALRKRIRLADAESEYWKAMQLDPSSAIPHSNLAIVLADTGRISEAETQLRQALALYPTNSINVANRGDFILLARIYMYENRLAEAEDILHKVIDADPKYPLPCQLMAQVIAQSKPDKAEQAYRKTVAQLPDDPEVLNCFGFVLGNNGAMLKRALALTEHAARLEPTGGHIWDSIGWIRFQLGEYEQAERDLKKSIRLLGQSHGVDRDFMLAQIWRHLALDYEALKQYARAENAYRESLKRAPANAEVLNNLAWRLAERGRNLDEALGLAKLSVKAAPRDGGILDTLGWVHFKRAEYAQAETDLRKAIELQGPRPEAADSWFHLGAVYEKINQIEKAKEAYRKALSLQPKSKDAADALKRLRG